MNEATASQFIGIGPLAEKLGVSRSLIRKWEAQGMLPPPARLAGSDRRVYRLEDVEVLREQARLNRRDGRRKVAA